MDLRRLEAFAKVYECKSFSRAAQEIFLSQPTVSGHIKSLEEELDLRLFDRLGRRIVPTKGADILYDYAKRILGLVEEAAMSLDAFMGRHRGDLLVGGSTIPGQYLLPKVLGGFHQEYPEVKVTLNIGDTGGVVEKVLDGSLELGVVGAADTDERLVFEPLMKDLVTLAAWPDHPLAGKSIRVGDLKGQPIVLREPGSGTRAFAEQALKKAGLDIDTMEVAAQVGSTLAVLQSVRSRVGLGFVSRRAMIEDMEANRLAEIRMEDAKMTRKFFLVTLKNRTLSPAAKAFIKICAASLREAPVGGI